MSAGQSIANLKPDSRLQSLGVARLKLLGKHSEQLMCAYINGHFDELSVTDTALDKLTKARILHRPDDTQPLSLRPDVNALIASLTEDERKRQINADVAGQLEHIRTRVKHFSDAQYRGDYAASELHFQLLTEKVHDMTGQFSDAITSLWNRLNSDFGFVSNLSDKIRENELAQQQLRRLLDGFELIDFNDMIELAHSSGPLRKLLVSQLQVVISDHCSSLLEVQKRLVELMVRFRQQQERAQLISQMAAFLKQHPNFEVADYPNRTQVPELINHSAPIMPSASIALDKTGDEPILAEMIKQLAIATHHEIPPLASAQAFELEDMIAVEAQQKQLKQDVENFFICLFEYKQPLSALCYLQEHALAWDGETWLFQVICEYEALARDTRNRFHCLKKMKRADLFNNVDIIEDIHLSRAL